MFALSDYMNHWVQRINTALDTHLPAETERPSILHQAMRYSVFAGGKRLRPILCVAAAESVGGPPDDALLPGIAIEILHTYTLIHDDLPAMDDDDLRRGKPTCHKVYGEANAILAGDALLTLAFEWLAGVRAPDPYSPNQLSLELAQAAGCRGVIGGQVEDMTAEHRTPDAALIEYIHQHKTAALIQASVRMGGIAAGATPRDLDALTRFGANAGLAFQIVDDILNETSTPEALGKAAGSDKERGKMTYVAVHGLDNARAAAQHLTAQALDALQKLTGNTEPLTSLAQTMANRTH